MNLKKILWSPSAAGDLRDVYGYVFRDSRSRAESLVEEIFARVEKLARFEKLGRMIPEIGYSRYRELIIGEYRVFHEIRQKEIFIFRVLHSKRLFNS